MRTLLLGSWEVMLSTNLTTASIFVDQSPCGDGGCSGGCFSGCCGGGCCGGGCCGGGCSLGVCLKEV